MGIGGARSRFFKKMSLNSHSEIMMNVKPQPCGPAQIQKRPFPAKVFLKYDATGFIADRACKMWAFNHNFHNLWQQI
jgi:hypothetical protein